MMYTQQTDYKTVIRDRFYHQAVDGNHLELIDEIFSPDCKFYASGEQEAVGRDAFKDYLSLFREALNFRHSVDDQIAEGDKVTTRWTVRGKHTKSLLGYEGRGNEVLYSGISIFEFNGSGQVVEVWSAFDQLGLHKQLGAAEPTPF
ncbi:ester cyclase [Acaryochloris sp. IP29b_bin.148]|uniref:ester cyclase n=1 Tax=Acaryochloris sp. IP29b_bin.148 TaxID=2969218 RepID=UPI00260217CE|nr:ester cyclase [Acaryochloris sp. IP29b_bin.148]